MTHTFVLCRRVGRPLESTERTLLALPTGEHDDGYGGLTISGLFERRTLVGPWGSGPPEREARGVLRVGRRETVRVVVELGPWARDASELRIRPATRRPHRWGGRYQARYFDAAHAAIDALARALEVATPAVPTVPTVPAALHHAQTRTA